MAERRFRIGPLDSSGSVASEHRKIYAEYRRGKLDGSTASRLSQVLMNQKCMVEAHNAEKRIEELEALLEQLNKGNVIPLRSHGH